MPTSLARRIRRIGILPSITVDGVTKRRFEEMSSSARSKMEDAIRAERAPRHAKFLAARKSARSK
jgi:hypothetical protein